VLLVHSGNRIDLADRAVPRFPASQVPAVRARVARLLETLRPNAVVSAPAAGADLVVLQEAIRLGCPIHVVVPIARESFVDRSVSDAGPEWVECFEAVVHHAATEPGCSLVQSDDSPQHGWYLAAHDQLFHRAELVAAGDSVVALTIRPPDGEHPPSATDDFAARAAQLDMLVFTIDPRPPSSVTVG